MITLTSAVKIFLFAAPADMRKGFDGLATLVRELGQDVFSGHLFVFVSRRGDRVKILTWDRGGFVLWYKRLERGRFRMPAVSPQQSTTPLDAGQLGMLIDGVDFSRVRRPQPWQPPRPKSSPLEFQYSRSTRPVSV